jgi:hypothetical protein
MMVGGIAGAVIFGVAGMYGGWKLAEGVIATGKFVHKMLFTKEPLSPEHSAALEKLKGIEDNPKDAIEDLKMITSNLKSDEKLDVEVENFAALLKAFGAAKSNESRGAYMAIKKSLAPGERAGALKNFQELSDFFGSPEKGMDGLYVVMKNLYSKESVADECATLVDAAKAVKKACPDYADVAPETAGEAYVAIKKSFPPSERKEALETTLGQLAQKKMEPSDLVENLKTVLDNRYKGEDLKSETANFMAMLGFLDNDSASARAAYATVKKQFAPADRDEAVLQFKELKKIEGDATSAMETLKTLGKMYEGETLKGEVAAFKAAFGVTGSHSSALEAYGAIRDNFKPGAERDKAFDNFQSIANAEKAAGQKVENAASDFKWLLQHMSKGEKLESETEKFCGLLKSEGSSSKARDKYLEAKFRETWKG